MTKQVTSFKKVNITAIKRDIDKAIAKIGEKYGIRLSADSLRYSEEWFTAKVTGKVKADAFKMLKVGGDVSMQLARKLEEHGLIANKDGKTLIDYKSRNRKYPFIYTDGDARYKCCASQAKALFSK